MPSDSFEIGVTSLFSSKT